MDFIPCRIATLPTAMQVQAAERACDINPANRPATNHLQFAVSPLHLAVMTSKYWGAGGVKLTVGFLNANTPADLQQRILSHMNAWGAYCNAVFTLGGPNSQVRIAQANDGYWSYLGPDILSIPQGQPTMNLQGITMSTPESEFHRVVRHETGHTLGCPHEHMRREIVARIDPTKAITYFRQTQGWEEQTVRQQVLTPLEESSILGTPNADVTSIMCYQLPGSITTDGQPIAGGTDIDPSDQAFIAKLYPLAGGPVQPPVNPPPIVGVKQTVLAELQRLAVLVQRDRRSLSALQITYTLEQHYGPQQAEMGLPKIDWSAVLKLIQDYGPDAIRLIEEYGPGAWQFIQQLLQDGQYHLGVLQ